MAVTLGRFAGFHRRVVREAAPGIRNAHGLDFGARLRDHVRYVDQRRPLTISLDGPPAEIDALLAEVEAMLATLDRADRHGLPAPGPWLGDRWLYRAYCQRKARTARPAAPSAHTARTMTGRSRRLPARAEEIREGAGRERPRKRLDGAGRWSTGRTIPPTTRQTTPHWTGGDDTASAGACRRPAAEARRRHGAGRREPTRRAGSTCPPTAGHKHHGRDARRPRPGELERQDGRALDGDKAPAGSGAPPRRLRRRRCARRR